jgi:formamidopyrimidine-DNA glycosylase
MPELPEVETVVRDLRREIIGERIISLERSNQKLRRPWLEIWSPRIHTRVIKKVLRRAKWIVLELDDSSLLVIHLGMTGQLTIESAAIENPAHLHFRFQFASQRELRYRDIRRFGSIEFYESANLWEQSLGERFGPEPWDVDAKTWYDRIHVKERNLKAILLDQSFISGVGNIYADESCFHSKLLPTRLGSSLTRKQSHQLLISVQEVLMIAIENRGSTIRNYVGGSGLSGSYQGQLKVYGRKGELCLECNTIIEGIRLAGRSTHYCPKCQK